MADIPNIPGPNPVSLSIYTLRKIVGASRGDSRRRFETDPEFRAQWGGLTAAEKTSAEAARTRTTSGKRTTAEPQTRAPSEQPLAKTTPETAKPAGSGGGGGSAKDISGKGAGGPKPGGEGVLKGIGRKLGGFGTGAVILGGIEIIKDAIFGEEVSEVPKTPEEIERERPADVVDEMRRKCELTPNDPVCKGWFPDVGPPSIPGVTHRTAPDVWPGPVVGPVDPRMQVPQIEEISLPKGVMRRPEIIIQPAPKPPNPLISALPALARVGVSVLPLALLSRGGKSSGAPTVNITMPGPTAPAPVPVDTSPTASFSPTIFPDAEPALSPFAFAGGGGAGIGVNTKTGECQVVPRRRRRKGKCREGFFKEEPGRTTYKTWRTVDCATGKTLSEV